MLFRSDLAPLADDLVRQWRGLTSGFHRLSFDGGRVLLTLGVGDARDMLREQAFTADAVFLDGFSPPLNPDMWALPTLKAVARLCRRGTRLATWTIAAQLRRDLATCGFQVSKAPGLPPKRDCLQAVFDPAWSPRGQAVATGRAPGRAAVIGAGLAGAAVAASLARRGWQVQVLDAADAPAAGASALPAGLLAPHTSPDDNLLSRLSRMGVRITLQQAAELLSDGNDWSPCGVLEQRLDDARPLPDLGEAGRDWQCDAAALAERPAHAQPNAVWHALAAWVRPAALVNAWLNSPGITWRGGCRVDCLRPAGGGWTVLDATGTVLAQADLVVVAAALDTAALLGTAGVAPPQLHPVRGQVSWAHTGNTAPLSPHALNGNGHFIPAAPVHGQQAWLCGSTYGRADRDTAPRGADHAANLQRLRGLSTGIADTLAPAFDAGAVQAWTGVRCTSRDRRPLVGELAPGLWTSTAMGSRGLTFAALSAELMAARLHAEPSPLPQRMSQALDVAQRGAA